MVDAFSVTSVASLSFQWFGMAPYMLDMNWAPMVGATIIRRDSWEEISEVDRRKMLAAAEKAGRPFLRKPMVIADCVDRGFSERILYLIKSVNSPWRTLLFSEAMPAWRKTSMETRLGVCLEILDRCAGQLFENAHATMHTSGQSYIMAFAGSGANALDRGLEALAYASKAMADVPQSAAWQRQFGTGAGTA